MTKGEALIEEAIERFVDAIDRSDFPSVERALRIVFALSMLEAGSR